MTIFSAEDRYKSRAQMQYNEYFAGNITVPGIIVCPKVVNPVADTTSGTISAEPAGATFDALSITMTGPRAVASLTVKCTAAFTGLGDDISAATLQQSYFITRNEKTSTTSSQLLSEFKFGAVGITAAIVFVSDAAVLRISSATTPWKLVCAYDYQVCSFE